MDPATSQMILEFIPQGGFAAFLLWQYIQQKKDLNASREEQKQDLALLHKEAKQDQEELRSRYEKVILELTLEKNQMRESLKTQVELLSTRLNELEKTLIGLVTKLEAITEQIKELRIQR